MRLRKHKMARKIPNGRKTSSDRHVEPGQPGGPAAAQPRPDIIAEILSWFDIIAIQECRENFADLFAIQNELSEVLSHRHVGRFRQ